MAPTQLLGGFSSMSLDSFDSSDSLKKAITLPSVHRNRKGKLILEKYTISKFVTKIVSKKFKFWPEICDKERKYLESIIHMKKEGLTSSNYKQYIGLMLFAEELFERAAVNKHYYKSVKMSLDEVDSKWFPTFTIPGILDKNPNVIKGDEVLIKLDEKKYFGTVHHVSGSKVFLFPDKINLKLLGTNGQKKILTVSIQFLFNGTMFEKMFKALALVASDVISCLFPKHFNQNSLDRCSRFAVEKEDLFNKSIYKNKEQLQAVRNIVAGSSRSCPYIILGPPGTGKTSTVAEAILQVWKNIDGAQIVVATPSNSAADVLAEKLLASGELNDEDIIRVCSETREDRPNSALKDITVYGAQKKIGAQKIVVVTLGMSSNLQNNFTKGSISHFFIDEAGQATEPELLLTLARLYHAGAQVILAGDPFQLGPVVQSHVALQMGLGVSPLERLIKRCPLYAKNSAGKYCPKLITKLRQNYRAHNVLLQVPNELFYEDELVACADSKMVSKFLKWSYLPNKGFPLLFHSIKTEFRKGESSPSSFNLGEAKLVLVYVKRLLGMKVKASQIGIITPYRAQVRKILDMLRPFEGITVGSTEEFQGQERLVTIISTVRSTLKASGKESRAIGFLANPKRFNVAITRAQALSIVIGDAKLLATDEMWGKLVSYCEDNNAVVQG